MVPFALRKCPTCKQEFAVEVIVRPDGSNGLPELAHCVYCTHSEGGFLTAKQLAEATEAAKQMAIAALQGALKGRRSPLQGTKQIRMKSEPTDHLTNTIEFACCKKSVRDDGSSDSRWCPYCGTAKI